MCGIGDDGRHLYDKKTPARDPPSQGGRKRGVGEKGPFQGVWAQGGGARRHAARTELRVAACLAPGSACETHTTKRRAAATPAAKQKLRCVVAKKGRFGGWARGVDAPRHGTGEELRAAMWVATEPAHKPHPTKQFTAATRKAHPNRDTMSRSWPFCSETIAVQRLAVNSCLTT